MEDICLASGVRGGVQSDYEGLLNNTEHGIMIDCCVAQGHRFEVAVVHPNLQSSYVHCT